MARRSTGFVSKKSHRKSRGGCSTCKRKKVKCDEGQPVCSYCSLRRLRCDYLQHSSSPSLASATASSNSSSPASADLIDEEGFRDTSAPIISWLVPTVQTASGIMSGWDAELLHHYKFFTWQTLTPRNDEIVVSIHSESVPRLSLSHTYLLHALLSIAASHRNSLAPSKQAAEVALLYRQKTLVEYSKALQNITAENYESVLVTGILLMSLIPPPESETAGEETYLPWIDSVLKMSEGLRILASLRWAAGIDKLSVYPLICRELWTLPTPPIFHSSDSRYFYTRVASVGTTPEHPNPPSTYYLQHSAESPVFLPPSLMDLLASLDIAGSDSGPIDMHVGTLYPVLHAFSPIFLSLYYYHLNPDFFVRVFVFCSFLMPEFLLLVRNREPRALVMIAWWWALAGLSPRGWWVGKSVERVVEAISRVVMETGDPVTRRACEGARGIIHTLGREGSQIAAKGIFGGWSGVDWDEGPKRAEDWEASLLRDWDTKLNDETRASSGRA